MAIVFFVESPIIYYVEFVIAIMLDLPLLHVEPVIAILDLL